MSILDALFGSKTEEDSAHMRFYNEEHPYDLEDVGLNRKAYNRLFADHPGGEVREVIRAELERRSVEAYKQGTAKGKFQSYCVLLRTMAMFLKEEGRCREALAIYMRYVYYTSNFVAGVTALKYYNLAKNVKEAADILFMNAEIHPFIADEIRTLGADCGMDDEQLHAFIKDAFAKEEDEGAFTDDQLVQMVLCGLDRDREGQKQICKDAMMAIAMKKAEKG